MTGFFPFSETGRDAQGSGAGVKGGMEGSDTMNIAKQPIFISRITLFPGL